MQPETLAEDTLDSLLDDLVIEFLFLKKNKMNFFLQLLLVGIDAEHRTNH